jgi:hypothetical protein
VSLLSPTTAGRAGQRGVAAGLVCSSSASKGRNVQLDTVADVADAPDVYIEMRVRPQPKGKRARHAPIEVLAA